MHLKPYLRLVLATWCAATAHAQTVVDNFEYPSGDDLAAAWVGSGNAVVSATDAVAATATGKMAMQVQFSFPSTAWATESIRGPQLPAPISIQPAQYLSFRVKGDPAFKGADFRNLYLYAWDEDGNFGRWGGSVPTSDDWQVLNYSATAIEKPWDSVATPDLTRIVQFAFYQYGSEAAIAAYSATIAIDDLTVRDTPLTEAAVNQETVIDAFEYATDATLAAAWKGDANSAVTRSDAVAPLSLGAASMRVQFSFPSMEWSTDVVTGPVLTNPVPIGPKQFLSFRLKGDPAFAAADFRTLYVVAYDAAGNFGRWGTNTPTTADWQTVNLPAAQIEKPWNSPALPDMGKLVRFDFVQYGSEKALPAYAATIGIDDLMVRNTPLADTATLKETVIDAFEYATADDLLLAWKGSEGTIVDLATAVAPKSPGKTAMQVQFNFASAEWVTGSVSGPQLTNPIVIGPKQYLTFRLKGDPAFAAADFKNLYLYAYDTEGNFGRWGAEVPTTADWTLFNFTAATIEKPWNSTALPDLSKIVRFSFIQYGSQAAIDAYSATIVIDDLQVKNAPVYEFPPAAAVRALIDDFEGYADATALEAFYTVASNPTATLATPSLASPAPQGGKALKLAVDFAAGTYPWGSVKSAVVAPFSFPTNAAVSLRFKGDASLASVADAGTGFWLSFYDNAGRVMNYITTSAPVVSADWVTLQARLADFGDTAAVDIGNLVQWRLLIQGWAGTADTAARSATFAVDDIRIGIAPAATLQVTGTAPAGLTGAPVTGIAVNEAGKVITADLPRTGQGFLTIRPAVPIKSVKAENGKLVIRW